MKHRLAWFVVLGASLRVFGQSPTVDVAISSHVVQENTRSVLIDMRGPAGQMVEEVRIELPRNAADGAILQTSPKDWKLERDGRNVRLTGPSARLPLRLKMMLFDLGALDRVRVRVRAQGRDVLDARIVAAELPALRVASFAIGFLDPPAVMDPGETVEMKVLDPVKTPADGQWIVGGVAAVPAGPDRIRVTLPNDYQSGTPLRISYFNSWGERIVDALSVQDSMVRDQPAEVPATPRISGCAQYGFIGQSLCVCGDFPDSSRAGLRLDGQPVVLISASYHVLRVALPETLAPGPHEITGDPAAGFGVQDKTSFLALRLNGSIDTRALLTGQSTTLRLGVLGTAERMTLIVTNKSPGVISIPGGNYQQIETAGGANNVAERRVDATGRGDFSIDYSLDGARCPCELERSGPSTASQPAPVFVPRRVLAIIAGGTLQAMYANAQGIAAANGMAVLEVNPLGLTNEGLVVFEVIDGIGVLAKAVAVAAVPGIALAQPDVVYDTSQAPAGAGDLVYGPRLIGADLIQGFSKGDGIRIAVIDTGVDTGHPALRQKVAEYSDLTGTGWTPDAHGSLVAGIIAADPADRSGGGVAPAAKLVAVKSCVPQSTKSAAARCFSSTLARGIDVASQKNVRVMNLSVGGPEDKLLAHMVDEAMKKGIAVVSAVGNDGPAGKPSYPAAFKGVISVTAVDAAERLYPQATRGNYVSLAAPGVDILSTGPGGRTQVFSGTSAATAFASAAVALLMQQSPKLSLPDLLNLLERTAKRLGPTAPDPNFGFGLLDVCRAMVTLANRQVPCR